MKAFLVSLFLLFLTTTTFAETRWFKAEAFTIRELPYGNWQKWVKSDLLISLNFDKKRIIVHSKSPQIFDYIQLTEVASSLGTKFVGPATDTKYLVVQLEFIVFDKGGFGFKVVYNDLEYQYQMKLYEE
jgi:hypothetical protein